LLLKKILDKRHKKIYIPGNILEIKHLFKDEDENDEDGITMFLIRGTKILWCI
jgi:hypothetical protein